MQQSQPTTAKLKQDGLTYCHFYDSHKPNYIFSNFYTDGPKLTVGSEVFNIPEAYFHAQKYPKGHPQRIKIAQSETPGEALRLGQEKLTDKVFDPKAWDAGENYTAMVNVVRARFNQDPEFKAALLSTEQTYLLEDTYHNPHKGKPDAIWGGGDNGMGQNLLGLALMQIRNEELNLGPRTREELEQLRAQAQQERREIDQQLGPDKTKGKSLSDIQQQVLAQQKAPASPPAPPAPAKLGGGIAAGSSTSPTYSIYALIDRCRPEINTAIKPWGSLPDGTYNLVRNDNHTIAIKPNGNMASDLVNINSKNEAELAKDISSDLKIIVDTYKAMYEKLGNAAFPENKVDLFVITENLFASEQTKADAIKALVIQHMRAELQKPENAAIREKFTVEGRDVPAPAPAAAPSAPPTTPPVSPKKAAPPPPPGLGSVSK